LRLRRIDHRHPLPPIRALACFVAGEPGGGSIYVVEWADAPPVGVWKREGAGAGSEWWTAGGRGYTTSWDVHTESSAPFLF